MPPSQARYKRSLLDHPIRGQKTTTSDSPFATQEETRGQAPLHKYLHRLIRWRLKFRIHNGHNNALHTLDKAAHHASQISTRWLFGGRFRDLQSLEFKSLSSFAIWILMLATVALLIDVEIQYRFRLAAQQNDIVQAGVEYFRRACETSSGIASFFKNQACADLVRRQSQVLGLGITRTGVFIDLLDGFSKSPASYVDLLDRVTRDVMKMSLAPRLVDLLQTGLNGAVDSGLVSFGTSWVAGKALKWVAGNMQLV